jgi:hypothetical protein
MTNRTVSLIASITLAGVLFGCSENPTASEPLVPSRMTEASSTHISAVAGTSVGRPSVIVRDRNGSPMKGVSVSFRVVVGSGSLNDTEAVTDASGIATAGEWTLSKTAGLNMVSATSGSLRVDFAGFGLAGPPAIVIKEAGDEQYGLPGSPLVFPPTVSVRDANDNPVGGAVVTFEVTGGGGSLSGSSTAVSDASGLARYEGWVIGSNGAQSLSATVSGVPPVTFTATVTTDPCGPSMRLFNGSTGDVALGGYACALPDGRLANLFSFNGGGAYTFELTGATFDAVLTVMTSGGIPVAEATRSSVGATALKVFLAKGDYLVRVTSKSVIKEGTYKLVATPNDPFLTGCEEVFIMLGTTTSQRLGPGDCEPRRGLFADYYRIYLPAGTRMTVTMSSNDVDNALVIADSGGYVYDATESSTLYDGVYGARLIFTAAKSDYYVITATTAYFSGEYELSVR